MKTIALISPFAMRHSGGVTTVIRELYQAIKEQPGCDAWILENSEGEEAATATGHSWPFRSFLWDQRIHWRPLLHFALTWPRERRHLAALIRERQSSLVHLHYFEDYYLHFPAAQLPIILTLHGSDVRQDLSRSRVLRLCGRYLMARSSRIVLPSRSLQADFLALMPQFAGRTRVIINGIALAAPQALERPLPASFILCTGNLQHVKGQDLLIRALALLRPSHPDLYLILAGDGPQRPVLQQLVQELELQERVLLPGRCSAGEVRWLLDRCLVYAQPSRAEGGHPLAVMEAMLAGKAVVGTMAGGLAEMIVDGRTGLTAAGEDPRALAAAIGTLLDQTEHRHRLAAAGQLQAQSQYTRAAMQQRYWQLYEEVLNEHS